MPGRGLCGRCRKGVGRARGECAGCGKPDRLLDDKHLCRWCRERARKRCPDCGTSNLLLTGIEGTRVCDRCALTRHLDRVLLADGSGALHRLRPVILHAEPLTTRRWLTRTGDLLADLDTGRLPLNHDTLDGLPKRKAAEYLRALLIAAGLLQPDPHRDLRRLEAHLPDLLASLDTTHRQITTRWIQWAVLPRLRALEDQHRIATGVSNAARQIEQVASFLTDLQHAGRHIDAAAQHDIDTWFAGPGTIRQVIRPFLTWARRSRELPRQIALPPAYAGKPVTPLDAEERWQIARRLVTDDTLDPVDRIAGTLVVLYAQPLARIVTLTTDDVIAADTGTSLKLGTDALELPEPFATLIRQLPIRRRASPSEQILTHWLFTGSHAGRPLTAHALGGRLRMIGIEPRRLRLAAAEQLTREIPPAMIAGVLGLRPQTIARTGAKAAGPWANYAADRPG